MGTTSYESRRANRSKFVDWKGRKPNLECNQSTEEFIEAQKKKSSNLNINSLDVILKVKGWKSRGVQSFDEHEYPIGGIYYEFNKNPKIEKIYSEFYRSEEWKNKRTEIIAASNGSCVVCGVNENLVVDHITPLRADWDLRLSNYNLQVMCKDCNKEKAASLTWHLYTHQQYVKWRKERNLEPMLGVCNDHTRRHIEEFPRSQIIESSEIENFVEEKVESRKNKSPILKKRTSLNPPKVGDIVYEDSGIYSSPLFVQKIEWDYVTVQKKGKQYKPKRLKIDKLYVLVNEKT